MKQVLSILFLALPIACSTPTSKKESGPLSSPEADGIPAAALREKFDDTPGLEGIIITNGPDILSTQGTLLNGKREGTWTDFYPNGMVKSITPYVNGKKEGCHVEINTNGQLVKRITYHNDLKHGEYKEFNYSNLKEERFYKNDKLEGMTKIYYGGGKILMEEGSYKEGLRDGVSRWYDQEGKLSIEYEYKNGELVKK